MQPREAALEWAARGFRVFPARGKVPFTAGEDWRTYASDLPPVINLQDWQGADTYGVALHQHVVLDLDTHTCSREEVMAEFAERFPDCPETLVVGTPSGGLHAYFQASSDDISQRSLVPGRIDVRAPGKGYVIGPGTGGYVIENDVPPAPLPASIRRACTGRTLERAENRAPACELDQPEACVRAWKMLCHLPPNNPAGEDGYRYRLAAQLLDEYGLSEDKARELLHQWNVEKAQYPRSPSDIDKAVENAARYARRPPGEGWQRRQENKRALAEAVGISLPEQPPSVAETITKTLKENGLRLTARTLADLRDMPPPQWFVPGWILANGVTTIYGPPKRGKTFATVDLALATAYDRPWLGSVPIAEGTGAVVFLCLERASEAWARALAWCDHYKVPMDNDRFIFVDGTASFQTPETAVALVTALKALPQGVRLLTVDTLAKAMPGADEQSSRDTGSVMLALETLGVELKCPVVAVHHSGKDAAKGMRGSTAILASVAGAISAEMEDGVLTLTLRETSRGKAGAELHAVASQDNPEHPVFGPMTESVGDTSDELPPPPDVRNVTAVVNAAASEPTGSTVRLVPMADFANRLVGVTEWRNMTPRQAVSLLYRTLEKYPSLREVILCDEGQAAVFPVTERPTLFKKAGVIDPAVSLHDLP